MCYFGEIGVSRKYGDSGDGCEYCIPGDFGHFCEYGDSGDSSDFGDYESLVVFLFVWFWKH